MENPWEQSRTRIFHIHPDDDKRAGQYNKKANPDAAIQRSLPALPYIGNPNTARVILLGKNPSYSPVDDADADPYPAIREENLKALVFESVHPFFYLDPRFAATNGYRWWEGVLGRLLEACAQRGVGREVVLGRLGGIQFHPYRSQKSFVPKEPFPTQEYGFFLARQATERGALFVIQYGAANERLWREMVPTLPTDAIRVRSAQNSDLTPGNMSPADWERLVAALTAPENG